MRRGSLAMACIEDYDLPAWVDPTNPAHWLQIGAVVCFDGFYPMRFVPTTANTLEYKNHGQWCTASWALDHLPTGVYWHLVEDEDGDHFPQDHHGLKEADLPTVWRAQ